MPEIGNERHRPGVSSTSDAPQVEPAPVSPPPADNNAEMTSALNRLDGFTGRNDGLGVQAALGDVKRIWSKQVERTMEARPDFRTVTESASLKITAPMSVAVRCEPQGTAVGSGSRPTKSKIEIPTSAPDDAY